MSTHNNASLKKMTYNGQKVKKWYHNGVRVYAAGSTVTYYVDTATAYTEEVDSEATCLSPKTFTPTKSGWSFVGWREDKTASGSVLTSKVMGDSPVTLYAVFTQNVTVTYYNNTTTAATTKGSRYYNNSNIVNPSFKIAQASKSGWSARGWSTGTAGNSSINYNNNISFTRDSDVTLYGMYQKTCTLTAISYNSNQTATGTAYYNSNGKTVDATTKAPNGASYSGWSWRGWSASGTKTANAAVTYVNGGSVNLGTSDMTIYGLYSQEITCSFVSSGTQTAKGTRYYNAAGNTANASVTVPNGVGISGWTWRGWSAAGTTAGNASVAYTNGATISNLSAGATYYGLYQKTCTANFYSGINRATHNTSAGTAYYNASGNYTDPTVTFPTGATVSGWTWRGWGQYWDDAAAANVAHTNGESYTFNYANDGITFYGLYQQTITVTYYDNSSSASTATGTRYHNSANTYSNPSFTLTQKAVSGWSARGWSTSNAGNAGIAYNNGATFTRDSNITLYGLYQKTVTVTYNGNGATGGSTASQTGTAYWAPAGTINASFTVSNNGYSRTEYVFSNWLCDGNYYSPGATISLFSDVTFYAQWRATQLVVYQSVINYSNPDYTAVGASVSVSQHNTSYVTISSTHHTYGLGTGQSGHGIDDVTRYININYNGYTSATIEFTLAGDNVYNWDDCEANVYINGSLIYDGYHAIQPGSYTLTTSSTSIPIRSVAELADESSIGWIGVAIAVKITLK